MSYSQKSETGYLSFAKGLATEVNPLSITEELQGTTSDELNMAVDTDGMVRVRRAGFGLLGVPQQAVSGKVLEVKYWRSGTCYVVCSYSDTIVSGKYLCTTTFIDEEDPSKDRAYQTSVYVTDFLTNPQVVFLRTKCVVTYGGRPLVFTREVSKEFSVEYIDIYVRDFRLLEDGLTVTERPTTLTDEHRYNLLNTGWYQFRRAHSSGTLVDPINEFHTIRTKYPSNADIAALGDITNSSGDLRFDPNSYDNINIGSSEAPRGHYVYNVRNINRDVRSLDILNDGIPSSTLSVLLDDGNDPTTGLPPVGPIDSAYPEPPIPPEGIMP